MWLYNSTFVPPGATGLIDQWSRSHRDSRCLRAEKCRRTCNNRKKATIAKRDDGNYGEANEKVCHVDVSDVSRRAMLRHSVAFATAVAASTLFTGRSSSAKAARTEKSVRRMSGDYKADAAAVLEAMKQAWELPRGAPGMVDTVKSTRKQMNEFVAMYRRNNKVAGSLSFSTLYTAINTLSGHYASFGPSYPVPEKRRKRLNTQFNEINRALARGR